MLKVCCRNVVPAEREIYFLTESDYNTSDLIMVGVLCIEAVFAYEGARLNAGQFFTCPSRGKHDVQSLNIQGEQVGTK